MSKSNSTSNVFTPVIRRFVRDQESRGWPPFHKLSLEEARRVFAAKGLFPSAFAGLRRFGRVYALQADAFRSDLNRVAVNDTAVAFDDEKAESSQDQDDQIFDLPPRQTFYSGHFLRNPLQ